MPKSSILTPPTNTSYLHPRSLTFSKLSLGESIIEVDPSPLYWFSAVILCSHRSCMPPWPSGDWGGIIKPHHIILERIQNVYDVMTLYHKSPCHPIATLYQKIYIKVANLRGKMIAVSLYNYNMLSAKKYSLSGREASLQIDCLPVCSLRVLVPFINLQL